MTIHRVLYIGQYQEGSTSKQRADTLKALLKAEVFEVIDTSIPFNNSAQPWRSLAFRLKIGKTVACTNTYVLDRCSGRYDLIWVDKAILLSHSTTQKLRAATSCLVHYTPDTAFKDNVSKLFYSSLPLYDFAITTKSFEKTAYQAYIKPEQILLTTQGYDSRLHYPRHPFGDKAAHVVFIGLYEPYRAQVLSALLKVGVPVVLAGKKWSRFVKQHQHHSLQYLGEGLFAEAYATALSKAQMALGLLSKRFPELHTTRTFEIPACGTVLLTERTVETAHFFRDDEVVFYKDIPDLVHQVQTLLKDPARMKTIAQKGTARVQQEGYDYREQLRGLLQKMELL